ncbi:hypothetical protein MMC20_002816 [Loxospora ochrophaea]|nr:hypothetical protein [Loxospora ochrophaea]
MSTTVLNPELIPAQTPPPGMVSNLKDPSSQGYVTITVLVIVMCITTPFVLLRMWTRKFINQKLWWDDCCCVLGWIGLLSLAGLMFRCLAYGGTIDQWNVSEANIKRFNSTFKDVEIVARIGMFFTKVSILLLFQRIFLPPNSPKTKIYWAIWFVFWWNLLYALALVITVLTECVGKEEIEARGGECINTYAVLIGASAINMISDLMIMVIPIAAVWNLHMLPPQKIRLSAVFAIGSLAVFASTARLGYQVSAAKSPNQTVVVMDLSLLKYYRRTNYRNHSRMYTSTAGIFPPCIYSAVSVPGIKSQPPGLKKHPKG